MIFKELMYKTSPGTEILVYDRVGERYHLGEIPYLTKVIEGERSIHEITMSTIELYNNYTDRKERIMTVIL